MTLSTTSGSALRVGVTADLQGFNFQAANQVGFSVHNSGSSATAAYFSAAGNVTLTSAGSSAVVNGVDGILLGVNGTERARITSGGELLVGTTSALGVTGEKVTIANNNNTVLSIVATNDTTPSLQFRSNSVDRLTIDSSSTFGAYFNVRSNQDIRFGTNNTERARISSDGTFRVKGAGTAGSTDAVQFSGSAPASVLTLDASSNLLLGTTSTSYGSIPGRFTSCSATAGSAGLFYTGFSGDVSTSALNIGKFDNDNSTSQIFVKFGINNAGTGSGQINANGGGAVAFGSFSDRRLKENIEPLASQLSSICALNPVEFDYKTGGHQIGFIAQEMQEIYPDTVGEDSDGMLSITGWSKTEARLVKAIQEQQALINDLRARVAALEA
jgi:hypothetical protein